MKQLHAFKAGKRPDSNGTEVEITAADLAATARAYNPELHEAPLVFGHPSDGAPAGGWVQSVIAEGDDLFAIPHQVDPAFAEDVKSGRHKKISASFFLPDSPHNPTPGVFYLRHVGFLGAQVPAVKGLKPVEFSDTDADCLYFEECLMPPDENKPDSVDFAEREAALNARQEEIAAREKALQTKETAARLKEHADFAEGLVKEGKLLPRQQQRVTALLATLPTSADTVSFAEDGEMHTSTPLALFKGLLQDLPNQVEYAELSKAADTDPTGVVNFAAPHGFDVDSDTLRTHQKAVAYQRTHNVDYVTAVQAVGG